jgi:hypothetical protein
MIMGIDLGKVALGAGMNTNQHSMPEEFFPSLDGVLAGLVEGARRASGCP